MNRDDIIKLFEKANGWSPAAYLNTMEDLERFASLVAAQEREACARVCEEPGWNAANWCAKAIRARGEK